MKRAPTIYLGATLTPGGCISLGGPPSVGEVAHLIQIRNIQAFVTDEQLEALLAEKELKFVERRR